MPGSIPAHNSGSFMEKIRKIQVAKWGKQTKTKCNPTFKIIFQHDQNVNLEKKTMQFFSDVTKIK